MFLVAQASVAALLVRIDRCLGHEDRLNEQRLAIINDIYNGRYRFRWNDTVLCLIEKMSRILGIVEYLYDREITRAREND